MADDYGTCPNDVFDDERLEGAPLSSITGYVVLIMLADDHGIFDANSRVLARRLGCGAPEVSALLADLSERKLVQVYDCNDGERDRRGGLLLGFHTYLGHPTRVAFASKRGASVLPFPDGSRVASRRARTDEDEKRVSPVEAPRKSRGSGVAATRNKRGSATATATEAAKKTDTEPTNGHAWQSRGSGVEAAWQSRGNGEAPPTNRSARAPEQHSTAQHSEAGGAASAPPMPSAPRSTDAHARQAQQAPSASASATNAPPASPAPLPALGAREAPQEDPGEDEPPTPTWEPTPWEFPTGPTRTELLAQTRGPPPRRSEFASVEGYEAARQAWIASGEARA